MVVDGDLIGLSLDAVRRQAEIHTLTRTCTLLA